MKAKRWLRIWRKILTDIFSYLGLYWLFVEIFSYSSDGGSDKYFKNLTTTALAFLVILILASVKNRPRKRFTYKLRGKDNFIEVKVGNAFKNKGALIVPINDFFDVNLGGNVKGSNSIQSQLIEKFYDGRSSHLEGDIAEKIELNNAYEIGTVAEVEQKKKKFYLAVNSRKKENNRVESTLDDFLLCLTKLWEYIALESGRNDEVTIPIISTRHGRISDLNRTSAIKEIIRSYIEASKYYDVADKLIISISENDILKGRIDLDEIDDYLKFSCLHYRHVKFSTKEVGSGLNPSEVSSIET